ncbi:hypothetical protein Skr01_14440 [Sphaerisporangium krabiense]|nr:hypothetical protein Skr01_14440 [Sphaerisporangium krabiense]
MAGEVLVRWGYGDLADDVILVIGELLGNAVSHGAPPFRLSLWATTSDLCVRVTDHGLGIPRRLHLTLEAVHGRGLSIVAALAHEFGVIPLPDPPGKIVWARWRTPSGSGRPPSGAGCHRPQVPASGDATWPCGELEGRQPLDRGVEGGRSLPWETQPEPERPQGAEVRTDCR